MNKQKPEIINETIIFGCFSTQPSKVISYFFSSFSHLFCGNFSFSNVHSIEKCERLFCWFHFHPDWNLLLHSWKLKYRGSSFINDALNHQCGELLSIDFMTFKLTFINKYRKFWSPDWLSPRKNLNQLSQINMWWLFISSSL